MVYATHKTIALSHTSNLTFGRSAHSSCQDLEWATLTALYSSLSPSIIALATTSDGLISSVLRRWGLACAFRVGLKLTCRERGHMG